MPTDGDGLAGNDSPFAGAAAYYHRYRASYPPAVFDLIVEYYHLGLSARVLDLGCGPGTIAIPLSRAVGTVDAVDPDFHMLEEGRLLASNAGCRNIRWIQGRAEDVPLGSAAFEVATLGQSFHWMHRDEVLDRLDGTIAKGGGLALVNPGRRRPQESWEPLADKVVERFLGRRPRHPAANPLEPANEPALLRSRSFRTFEALEFSIEMERDVASVVGCVLSRSSSSPALFGTDLPAFEAELSAALLECRPGGVFRERTQTEVTLASRQVA